MKNFFKKLALVLALALVVTVVAPAAASKSEAASIAISSKSEDVSIGKSYNFNIKNKVKGSTYKWSTSDKSIATVNSKNGVAKGVKVGTATISCKITLPNKTTKTVKATFNVRPDATAVAISNPVTKMDLGNSHDFNRTMTPANSANKTYWIVKDAAGKEVANTRTGVGASIMSSKGVFTPAAVGTYTITAECWRSKTASVKRAESTATTVTVVLPAITSLAVKEETFDDDTLNQKLTVLVNGVATDVSALVNAGYKVEFQAEAVDGSNATDLFKSGLATSSDGVLDNTIPKDTAYKVSVSVSKIGEYFASAKATIKVENLDAAVSSVTGATYKLGTLELTKNQLVLGEVATLDKLTYIVNSAKKEVAGTSAKLTSSNPSVLYVNGATVTALNVGTATITATYGNRTFTTTFTVNKDARKVSSITPLESSSTVASTTNGVVKFKVTDQYGEAMNGLKFTENASDSYLSAISNNKDVATINNIGSDVSNDGDGIYRVKWVFVGKGTTNITLQFNFYDNKNNDHYVTATGTCSLTVTDNTDLRREEVYVKAVPNNDAYSTDAILDLASDNKIRLGVKGYNNANVSLGDQNITAVESTNVRVVKVDTPNTGSYVDLIAEGSGSADVKVTTATGTYTIRLTVSGSTMKMTGIALSTKELQYSGDSVDYSDILTITKTGTNPVISKSSVTTTNVVNTNIRLVPTDGTIYIDANENGQYDLGTDTKLGTITVAVTNQTSNAALSFSTNGLKVTVTGVKDAAGIIVYQVKDADNNLIASSTVNVIIK